MKKILLFILLYLTYANINAQITTSINNVYLNNQTTVLNCNTLDFGTVQNNNLVFYFKLSRPQSLPSGTGKLRVMFKLNSTSNPQIIGAPQDILDSFWNGTSYETTISRDISASQVQQTGSSIYLEFETSGGNKTSSCSYPITKTPTPQFNLQPTTVSLACGSAGSRVFTAVNVNNSPGTLSYSWNVGTGWKYNGVPVSGTFTTTTNVIQLLPASGTGLPSNVTMTATLNGVPYPPKTATVTRYNIIQTITAISGASTLCSGSYNYNFGSEQVLPGQSVSWSLSNSNVGTLSNGSNTGVNLNLTGSGAFTLTATIYDGCGQSYSKTKNILVGSTMPTIDGFTCITDSAPCNLNVAANNNYLLFSLSATLGSYVPQDSDWQWEKVSGNFYFLENSQYNSNTRSGKQANIYLTGPNPTDKPLQFKCRVKNSCGWGPWRYFV
ncbi:hypothetical protein [Mariniflexile sp.]|uniref:hypothetical protein n=1 Tax=Mariniflexile sp. TaxID=1979402 RepID=UPI00404829F3